jgi:hypothetical protein
VQALGSPQCEHVLLGAASGKPSSASPYRERGFVDGLSPPLIQVILPAGPLVPSETYASRDPPDKNAYSFGGIGLLDT